MRNIDQMLVEANGLLAMKNVVQAIALCEEILDESPRLPDAVRILSLSLISIGKVDLAIKSLKDGLQTYPNSEMLLSILAEQYLNNNKLIDAELLLNQALSTSPEHLASNILLGVTLVHQSRNKEAEIYLRSALSIQQKQNQDILATYHSLSAALMPGESYGYFLTQFHRWINPGCYVEIGVETGATLALAQTETIAIGIDPNPVISVPLSNKTQVYDVESDIFFKRNEEELILKENSIDFSFIDGLHIFDQALRDFINVEKFSHSETVIAIHDCLPLDALSSEAERTTNFWSGDTWKVMAILRCYRPDLTCFTIPASPTGLGVVSNLDPKNTILEDNYDEIIAIYKNKNYDWLVEQGLDDTLGVFESDWSKIKERIKLENKKSKC